MMGANLYSKGVLKTVNSVRGDLVLILSPEGDAVAYGRQLLESDEIFKARIGVAVETLDSIYRMPKLREMELFSKGLVYDQSLPSILVGHILSPSENDRVIDMCAAPGGKSTHAAQLMNNKGKILSCDRSNNRLNSLKQSLDRLGIRNIQLLKIDARELLNKYNLKFDKVILDPPCTTLGHRPKIYDTMEISKSYALSAYQIQLFKVASKIMRRGGYLVYSTCTLPHYENESVVKYACDNLGFSIQEPPYKIAYPGEMQQFLPDLELCQRFYPDIHDAPGFFICLLRNGK